MKKILTIILASVLCLACVFGMTACKEDPIQVGAQQGTTGFKYASCLKGCEAKGYETPLSAVMDMKNGKIKYVIVDKATASTLEKEQDGIKMIDIALTSEDYAIGIDRNQAQLKEDINGVLADKATEVQAIIDKYMAGNESEYVTVTSAEYDANNQAGQLVVATNAEFPPFEAVSGNGYNGIDMEIAQLIATELDLELVIKDMAFEAVVSAVGVNGVDIVMAALTVTADRKTSINFSNPYYKEAQVLLTLESNTEFDEAGTVIDILSVLCAKA
ncbi:MAG: transporter substrate-binding domain-containing protein [Clostridia bacterium]|nr:transporter substrate-binding domain-containing protein [Clostridia bacterium]